MNTRPETDNNARNLDQQASKRPPARDVQQALFRGGLRRGRCPHCGEGRIFRAFLKVNDNCHGLRSRCCSHHRADDFPAYLVIVIVGHIIGPLVLLAETDYSAGPTRCTSPSGYRCRSAL